MLRIKRVLEENIISDDKKEQSSNNEALKESSDISDNSTDNKITNDTKSKG